MPNTALPYMQPIIRGVQSVGAVQILYRYNNYVAEDNGSTGSYQLPLVDNIVVAGKQVDKSLTYIDCGDEGIPVAGFRLDSEFLRANPQIASSFVIPVLGGGGVALTNNNRTGTLNLVCARVAAPDPDAASEETVASMVGGADGQSNGLGVLGSTPYYDFVTLAQIQQGQEGGDSVGAQIKIKFFFCNIMTTLVFEGCTIATVDPIGIAGNDAVNYAIAVNYLNWRLAYSSDESQTPAWV